MTTMTFALLINWNGDGSTFVDESAYLLDAHVQVGMRDRHTGEDAAEHINLATGLQVSAVMGFGSMLHSVPNTGGSVSSPGGSVSSPTMSAADPEMARGRAPAKTTQPAHHSSGRGHGGGHAAKAKVAHVAKKPPKPHHYPHQVGSPHKTSTHQSKVPPDRGPIEFVADVGSASVLLENSSQRFSPDYSSGPLYGNIFPRRLVKITASDGVTTWPVFTGFIDRIDPQAGLYSDRHVLLECVDGIELLAFQKIGMALQTSQTAGTLVGLIVPLVYTPIAAGVYDAGASVMDYSADLWSIDRTTALDAIRECAESEFGRFFVDKSGAPTFRGRRYFLNPGAASITVDSTVPASIALARDTESVYNVVNVVAHPRATNGATITLANTNSVFMIPPNGPSGPGLRYFTLHFHDDSGTPIGGTNLISPVPTTDYTVNERRDGTGFDYTTYPTLTQQFLNGSEVQYLFSSTAIGPLFVTKFGVRGTPVTSYDYVTESQSDATSIAAYQKRTWTHDLPICADVTFADSLSRYLLSRYKTPFTRIDAVTIHNEATVGGTNLFSLGLFSLITVTEPQDGLANVKLWVIGQRIHITPYDFTVTFVTERADDTSYWILGTSHLGSDTRLAP